MAPTAPSEAPGFLQRMFDLVDALRRAGVAVPISEDIDAVASLQHLDLLDRAQFKEALASLLAKSHADRRTFDDLFDVYFPVRPGSVDLDDVPEPGEEVDPDGYLDELVRRLMDGDDHDIRRWAREAVDRFGRAEGRDGGTRWFQYRVWRAVDVPSLLQRLLEEQAAGAEGDTSELERRLWRDEFEARLRTFRREVEGEIRRRYAEDRGPEQVADRMIRPPLEEQDFFRLSVDEQAELRTRIRPLARKLATRLAVKRRHGRDGRLDVRRTVRRSLSTGGVPFDPEFRARKPHKPELYVLCDVSGSVASFARFTLMLVHTLQDQFSKVRSFAFVDTLDEVTRLFEDGDFGRAASRMMQEAELVWFDGHSDYGHSLEVFHRRYARDVTARSSVIVLGDARNNYRRSNAWVLEDLQKRARHVHWLNPEPVHHWGTGDSIAASYARYCDDMVEVRNLKQLTRFVERLTR